MSGFLLPNIPLECGSAGKGFADVSQQGTLALWCTFEEWPYAAWLMKTEALVKEHTKNYTLDYQKGICTAWWHHLAPVLEVLSNFSDIVYIHHRRNICQKNDMCIRLSDLRESACLSSHACCVADQKVVGGGGLHIKLGKVSVVAELKSAMQESCRWSTQSSVQEQDLYLTLQWKFLIIRAMRVVNYLRPSLCGLSNLYWIRFTSITFTLYHMEFKAVQPEHC